MFFELLQLALGQRERLSRELNGQEWQEVYELATKQALLGVCFAGIQRLSKEQAPPKELLFTWFGAAQSIIKRNAQLTEQCRILQKKLKEAGIRSAILKGQGVARYYKAYPQPLPKGRGDGYPNGVPLGMLRQPGDIDVYVDCGRERAIEFAHATGQKNVDWDYKHLHLQMFPGTEIEMHYRVEVLLNIWKNRKLQRWFKENEKSLFNQDGILKENTNNTNITNGFVMPSVEFNVFYILLHIYRHFLYEGVGLRQIVDYYMVLRKVQELKDLRVQECLDAVGEFGMKRFARGLMWVMQEVLGMPKEWMLWEADEKEGRFILEQVMAGGNFGHYDERLSHGNGKMGAVLAILKHNVHLLGHYPADTLWAPVWVVWHKCWKWSR